jgi:hypothetical protein
MQITLAAGWTANWLALFDYTGSSTSFGTTGEKNIRTAREPSGSAVGYLVRATWAGKDSGNVTLTGASIGPMAASPADDFSAAPAVFLFGGSAGGTVPGAGTLVSDALAFALDGSSRIGIHSYYAASPGGRWKTQSGFTGNEKNSGGNEKSTQTVTGYTAYSSDLTGCNKLEYCNNHSVSLSVEPAEVKYDGSTLTKNAALGLNQWTWSSGTLTVNVGEVPTTKSLTAHYSVPTAAGARANKTDPLVILGSIALAPATAAAKIATVDPTVLVSSSSSKLLYPPSFWD